MSVRTFVKRVARNVAPDWTAGLLAGRARASSQAYVRAQGGPRVNRRLQEAFGNRVLEGPFAGLVLSPMTFAEQIGPYLLGLYESELDPVWDAVLRGSYTSIVDVGAKIGYYAIGLARRFPAAEVVAFDTDPWARRALAEMAAANDVGHVRIESRCEPEWWLRLEGVAALVVSDCEGDELRLFPADSLRALRNATLIVETHDFLVPGTTTTLANRLAETHVVQCVDHTAARRLPPPLPSDLTAGERHLATTEVRGPQSWLVGLPRRDFDRK